MKTIYFVRHGLSKSNVENITSGAEDDVELTDVGRDQAKRAGRDLADKNIDTIVCSPMIRTVETAQIIAEEIGLDKDTILTNKDFIERYMRKYHGRPHGEYRKAVTSSPDPEGLESAADMVARVKRGFDWLQTIEGENIVLVSHGAVGRVVKIIQNNLHHDDMYKIDGFSNTEIYEFKI
jgi:broad specificity phosphatase PhoE